MNYQRIDETLAKDGAGKGSSQSASVNNEAKVVLPGLSRNEDGDSVPSGEKATALGHSADADSEQNLLFSSEFSWASLCENT